MSAPPVRTSFVMNMLPIHCYLRVMIVPALMHVCLSSLQLRLLHRLLRRFIPLGDAQAFRAFVTAMLAVHGVVPDAQLVPSRRCIRHGAQPGRKPRGDTERFVRQRRSHPRHAKSPGPVAG